MTTQHTENQFGRIPLALLDDDTIEDGAKTLFAQIDIDFRNSKPQDTVNQLAEKRGVTTRTIRRWRKQLFEKGYLNRFSFSEIEVVEFLKSKIPNKLPPIPFYIFHSCEWCRSDCLALQEHHYPVRKKDGGNAIVRICPNCHQEFHTLCDNPNIFLGGEECQ